MFRLVINTVKSSKKQRLLNLPPYSGVTEDVYIPTAQDISGYEWTKYYKSPNSNMKINWTHMRALWYWMAERLNIYYKRTILRQPFPWTKDPILIENKFTNCIRDLDRGTIVYIKEILSKMDEPTNDLVKRTKEVILNTQIYRMFIKYETWKLIGFLYLDNFNTQWKDVKSRLRKYKKDGGTIFHSAYMVPNMRNVNDNPETQSDKLENALRACDFFYEDIQDTYNFITTHSMKDCLKYLNHFKGVGDFNIYEWLCDWGMASRHVKHPIVLWTDDSYVNSGPGNQIGLKLIFEDTGGLTFTQLNFYLRASWRHYMKRYGLYNHFIELLPKWMNGDITVRVIEHSLCELQKYLLVYHGLGVCKNKFSNESKNNLDYLVL